MSVEQTIGVAALARILVRLGQGETVSVAQLAEQEGVARATGFDIVRRLAAAQLVRRGPGGMVSRGNAATALGFAAFGLVNLQGVAETLLALLHEQTDARLELLAQGLVLVGFGRTAEAWDLQGAIVDGAGVERARLRLAWRAGSGRAERAQIGAQFERARVSLESYLQD
ncbi:MAG: hypothetical protein JWR51_2476 [Devosia sp.]|uniref:hypothetical protein n=1 Tax=Devosia sp. TaxID=1871048 RepID=UPI0026299D0E|nr:hypothetical protein [Devosia sp.]MDB5529373.1 hypothetical protein [Devosia sp.]